MLRKIVLIGDKDTGKTAFKKAVLDDCYCYSCDSVHDPSKFELVEISGQEFPEEVVGAFVFADYNRISTFLVASELKQKLKAKFDKIPFILIIVSDYIPPGSFMNNFIKDNDFDAWSVISLKTGANTRYIMKTMADLIVSAPFSECVKPIQSEINKKNHNKINLFMKGILIILINEKHTTEENLTKLKEWFGNLYFDDFTSDIRNLMKLDCEFNEVMKKIGDTLFSHSENTKHQSNCIQKIIIDYGRMHI